LPRWVDGVMARRLALPALGWQRRWPVTRWPHLGPCLATLDHGPKPTTQVRDQVQVRVVRLRGADLAGCAILGPYRAHLRLMGPGHLIAHVITGILARHDAPPYSTRWLPPMGAILVSSLSHGGPPDHEEQDLARTHRPTQEEPQPTQGQVLLFMWGALGGLLQSTWGRVTSSRSGPEACDCCASRFKASPRSGASRTPSFSTCVRQRGVIPGRCSRRCYANSRSTPYVSATPRRRTRAIRSASMAARCFPAHRGFHQRRCHVVTAC